MNGENVTDQQAGEWISELNSKLLEPKVETLAERVRMLLADRVVLKQQLDDQEADQCSTHDSNKGTKR